MSKNKTKQKLHLSFAFAQPFPLPFVIDFPCLFLLSQNNSTQVLSNSEKKTSRKSSQEENRP
jgi:hypothetical protein